MGHKGNGAEAEAWSGLAYSTKAQMAPDGVVFLMMWVCVT